MRLAAALWCLALALRARSEPTTSEESLLEIHDLMDEMTDYEKDVRKRDFDGATHRNLMRQDSARLAALGRCKGRLSGGSSSSALAAAPAATPTPRTPPPIRSRGCLGQEIESRGPLGR